MVIQSFTLRTMSSLRLQIMTVTIFTTKRRIKTQATGFRIREIVNYTAEGVRSDSKHYCYGQTDYDANGGIGGRYFHTGAGETNLRSYYSDLYDLSIIRAYSDVGTKHGARPRSVRTVSFFQLQSPYQVMIHQQF